MGIKSFIVDKKYLKYSAEDFSQDSKFIEWVKNGKGRKSWEEFISENPGLSKDIETARKIIESLRMKEPGVPEEEMFSVWQNVENYYNQNHKTDRKVHLRKIVQFAAVFMFALTVGAATIFIYFSRNDNRFTEIEVSPADLDEAKLILAGGEEILLKEKESDIQFDTKGSRIQIDRDSTFSYESKDEENAMTQIVIPFGKRSNIQLSDGTKVWMNAGSRLIFPQKFTGKDRKVFLKGEAYFDVAKNKGMPFIVSTDNMNITVLGTEFNLRDNDSDNELEVVLVEGSVSLKENSVLNFLGKEIKLKPNEKAVYNKMDNKTTVESNVSVEYYTCWKEGLFEFNRESILNVFKKLSRYYNVRFVTESSVELNRKISGKLDLKESLDDVLKVVSDAAPITYRIEQDKIYINSRIDYLYMR